MEYRTLGRTGVQVSKLCFGTMSFGGDADEATSKRDVWPLPGRRHQFLRLCQRLCRRSLRGDPGQADRRPPR